LIGFGSFFGGLIQEETGEFPKESRVVQKGSLKSSEGPVGIAGRLVGKMCRRASDHELRSAKFRAITRHSGITKLRDS
jgi:hypothetical protein